MKEKKSTRANARKSMMVQYGVDSGSLEHIEAANLTKHALSTM